jgi:hypothetical protein
MKLFVNFDGLLGFVPAPSRDGMTVILVNALDAASGSAYGHNGYHICMPPHYPYLSIPEDNFYSGRTDFLIRDPEDLTKSRFIRFFDCEDLCVARKNKPCSGLVIAEGRRPGSAEPQFGKGEENDFSWLVELQRVDPDLGEIDPGCLLPDPPRNRVIGRVRLDAGRISTDEIAGPASDKAFIWQFKTMDGASVSPLCQALASRIVWETEFEDCNVTLRLTRFGFGGVEGAASEICLVPRPNEDWIEVGVGNLPLQDLLEIRGGYSRETSFYHFPLLARLAKKQSCRVYVPSIVQEPNLDSGLVRAGTTICIGGTFTG